MSETASRLDQVIKGGNFKGTTRLPKTKAVTLSSNGVITFNTHLRGALYYAGGANKRVVINIDKDNNEILIMVGDKDDRVSTPDASVGATNGAISAINVLQQLEKENDTKILPNGKKTSSYRYEDRTGALEVLIEQEGFLAVLLKNKHRKRNPKGTEEETTASDNVE